MSVCPTECLRRRSAIIFDIGYHGQPDVPGHPVQMSVDLGKHYEGASDRKFYVCRTRLWIISEQASDMLMEMSRCLRNSFIKFEFSGPSLHLKLPFVFPHLASTTLFRSSPQRLFVSSNCPPVIKATIHAPGPAIVSQLLY